MHTHISCVLSKLKYMILNMSMYHKAVDLYVDNDARIKPCSCRLFPEFGQCSED